jgi:hypothetical protein
MRTLAIVGLFALASAAAATPLDKARRDLAAALVASGDERARAAVRDRARSAILFAFDRRIVPAWTGTPWREVGCSAFVAAVLDDLGFRLRRPRRFAEARALEIQRALAPRDRDLSRFRDLDADRLAAEIARLGDGLYLIGLARHIGFVRVRGGSVDLVHSGRDGSADVRRERLELARVVIVSRPSGYWVTPVLTDDLVDRWLLGRAVDPP